MRLSPHPFLLLCIVSFLACNTCIAQELKQSLPETNAADVSIRQATIHCTATLSEADKDFIVRAFSHLETKVISCHADSASQSIEIRYNDKIKERDILEILQMNGYDSYLLRDSHIKIVLTANDEAREELVK